jgi:UDP-N-acetyl-D-glucosamine dehydrogenase
VITYSDPYVPSLQIDGVRLEGSDMLGGVEAADSVVIVTDHHVIDYAAIVQRSKLIVDTRNALKGFRSEKIVRL